MSLVSSLFALSDGSLPDSFDGLKSHLPLDWVESCLTNTGTATVRRRKLTCEDVVFLVVGMGLYRDRPLAEIIQRLDLVVPEKDGSRQTVANGAITPARDRVGAEPIRELFKVTAKKWASSSAERHLWRDLKLCGIDGVAMRVPDSSENRKEFELHSGASYPLVRACVLMALRSHLALACSFGGSHTSETTLAKDLLTDIPDNSLTILDGYYINYSIWETIRGDGSRQRHWLIRCRKDLQWRVLKKFSRGDELVEITPAATVRQKNPGLPATIQARVIRYRRSGFKTRVLITSLLDPKQYPAAEIAELYHERWELEIACDEIKTETLDRRETLRSKTPERIHQECWGLFIAYNVIRREIEATAAQLKLPPNRISFRTAMVLVRDLFMWAEVASPGKLPKMLENMRIDLRQLVLPPRRDRRYPRHVKTPARKYAMNKGHA